MYNMENIHDGLEHKAFYQRAVQNQQLQSQPSATKIPAGTKLVEEGKIDAVKQTPQKIRLQKIAEKKASLARANAEVAKKWWFVKPENILVTTNCPICADKCLLRVERPVCSACENKYELRGVVA